MHKGRVTAMLRHPVLVAEEMYVEYLQLSTTTEDDNNNGNENIGIIIIVFGLYSTGPSTRTMIKSLKTTWTFGEGYELMRANLIEVLRCFCLGWGLKVTNRLRSLKCKSCGIKMYSRKRVDDANGGWRCGDYPLMIK